MEIVQGPRAIVVSALEEFRTVSSTNARRRVLIGSTLYPPAEDRPVEVLDAQRRPMPTDGTVRCERLEVTRIEQMAGGAS